MTHKSPTTHVGLFKWPEIFWEKLKDFCTERSVSLNTQQRCTVPPQRPSKTLHKSDERRHVSTSAIPAWWLTLARASKKSYKTTKKKNIQRPGSSCSGNLEAPEGPKTLCLFFHLAVSICRETKPRDNSASSLHFGQRGPGPLEVVRQSTTSTS